MTDTTRTAIVTGGLSGMGLAISARLARAGHRVVIGARRGDDPQVTTPLLTGDLSSATAHALDVRSSESVAKFVGAAEAAYGGVDILVNAAGIYEEAEVVGHSDEMWEATLATNLTGTFKMIRAVMAGMKAREWGRIVNIASVAAHAGMEKNAAYCASKAGLLGLGRCVSLEGAAHGVSCVSISPTWVETEMLKSFIDAEIAAGEDAATVRARYEASNPQGKLVQPGEIAELAAFLVSDAGRAITMEDIQVNAGSLW